MPAPQVVTGPSDDPAIAPAARPFRALVALPSRWTDLALLLALVVMQIVVNDNWTHSPIGYIDPWMYVGFGISYSDPAVLAENYKIARLPWVLLEFLARGTLSPSAASWMLQAATLGGLVASLYLLLERTLGRNAAFFGAAFAAFYPFLRSTGGADYHNTLGGPLYVTTWLVAIVAAEREYRPAWLLLTGSLAALTVHTDILHAGLLPLVAAHSLVTYRLRRASRPAIARLVGWTTAGAIGITAVLGIVNMAFGRDFVFFSRLLELVYGFATDSDAQASWWHPLTGTWLLDARYLGLPAAVGLVSVVMLFVIAWNQGASRRPWSPLVVQVVSYLTGYVAISGLWIALQLLGQTALDYDYHAFPLGVPLVGALAALAAYAPAMSRVGSGFRLVVVAAFVAPLLLFRIGFDEVYTRAFSTFAHALPVTFWASVVALSLLVALGRRTPGLLIAAACVAVACFLTSEDPYLRVAGGCPARRAAQDLLDQAHRTVRGRFGDQIRIKFWGDQDELLPFGKECPDTLNLGYFSASLASSGFEFLVPPWDAKTVEQISDATYHQATERPTVVVYITRNEQRLDHMVQRFREEGATVHPELYQLASAGYSVPLHVLRVESAGGASR